MLILSSFGGDFLNFFPNGDEEVELIKFISKYQYLKIKDVKYFFSTQKYYRERIRNLVNKKYLRKIKLNLILDELGIEYVKTFGFEYNVINRNAKYNERLLRISNIGAFYHNCKTIKFIASFEIKDKHVFTTTGRRFIGIFDINGIEYLTYQIANAKIHDNDYISSVMYDIQKEQQYRNIIILVDDIKRINFDNFSFGMNQVLIIEDTIENREKLKYMNSINWHNLIQKYYKGKANLAEYRFCDYTDYKHKFISTFYFLDTEKITRIKYFLRENKNKNADIICDAKLENELKKELPTAHYIVADLEEYIDKERNYYD